MAFDTVIGFVPADGGYMLCADCAADDIAANRDELGWVVFGHSETDSPSHCDECGALIPESLTADGVAYVADAIAQYVHAAIFTDANGRTRHGGHAATLDEWRAEYGAVVDEQTNGREHDANGYRVRDDYGARLLALYDRLRERQTDALSVILTEYHPSYGRAHGTDADGAAWIESEREDGDTDDCAECGTAISEGWLCMDGGEVVCSSHIVTPQMARDIAANWHGGQSSALYALSSSGLVTPLAGYETRRSLATLDGGYRAPTDGNLYPRQGGGSVWEAPTTPLAERWRDRGRLRALSAFITGQTGEDVGRDMCGYARALANVHAAIAGMSADDETSRAVAIRRVDEALASVGIGHRPWRV